MANGIEDLHEKNKASSGEPTATASSARYESWRVFQGREDAEMLQEKSSSWSSAKASRGDYDDWDD